MEPGGPLELIGDAAVGVYAYVKADGTPHAVPVTPFVVDGRIVITSTLAYVAKAAAVRRNPRVALLAGGVAVATSASVAVGPTPAWCNTHIREAEAAKFPPTRQFLGIPFHECLFPWHHECLFPWHSGRVVIDLGTDAPEVVEGSDRVTVTTIDGAGFPRVTPLAGAVDLDVDVLAVPGIPDGPAVVLVHEEHASMADLRQLTLVGEVPAGRFTARDRRGSLDPGPTSVGAQLATVRTMRRLARADRDRLADWPTLLAS